MIARKTQKIIYNIVIICLLIGGVTYVCSRFIHLGNIEYTDNAQVKQHIMLTFSPNGDYVRKEERP